MTRYKILVFLIIVLGITGCNDDNGNKEISSIATATNQLSPITPPGNKNAEKSDDVDSVLISKLHWVNSLVENYIKHSENELIKQAIKQDFKEEFLWDQFISTDTAKYIVLHIGHDFESKFVTDGWLYIDTITRNIYEYDNSDDNLIRWNFTTLSF